MKLATESNWSEERIFYDGDEYFSSLKEGIAQARETIHLETYIFSEGSLGESIINSLADAARRGVRVRLLVDGIGSPSFDLKKIQGLKGRGIDTRVYHPLPWSLPDPLLRFPSIKRFWRWFALLNRRDHRKVCIVDEKSAWTGSLNIDDCHLRSLKGERAWQDMGVQVSGSGIHILERAFARAWKNAWGRPERESTGGASLWLHHALVLLNTTRLERRKRYTELLSKIRRAKRRIWVTNAYFSPHLRLTRTLIRAARSGVDVRILLPHGSDIFFMAWVSEAFYGRLLSEGIRIYEYLPTFLHAKSWILDDWAMIGSSNLNYRSLLHDLEADVVLSHPESLQSVTSRFETHLGRSKEITVAALKRYPLWRRVLSGFFLFFRYWL